MERLTLECKYCGFKWVYGKDHYENKKCVKCKDKNLIKRVVQTVNYYDEVEQEQPKKTPYDDMDDYGFY